eukprot:4811587-Pleurochrysis_carterae.AAC.1
MDHGIKKQVQMRAHLPAKTHAEVPVVVTSAGQAIKCPQSVPKQAATSRSSSRSHLNVHRFRCAKAPVTTVNTEHEPADWSMSGIYPQASCNQGHVASMALGAAQQGGSRSAGAQAGRPSSLS